MDLLSFLVPRTLDIYHSKLVGEIQVKRYLNHLAAWNGGAEQSGKMVETLWEKSLPNTLCPKNILILGLGCGVVTKVLAKKYPGAKITGIEIDPVMLEIGKKYFDLTGVKIILGDATKMLKKLKQKYDLILVDTYLGDQAVEIPGLAKILTKDGIVIFNVLEFTGNKFSSKNYRILKTVKTEFNQTFMVQLEG